MSDETAKLIADARIKSSMLRMGEPIAFGSDADTIDALIEALSAALSQLDATRAERDGLASVMGALNAYIEDFGKLGGGAMKRKYGDDPMLGFENVVRRSRQALAGLKHQGAET